MPVGSALRRQIGLVGFSSILYAPRPSFWRRRRLGRLRFPLADEIGHTRGQYVRVGVRETFGPSRALGKGESVTLTASALQIWPRRSARHFQSSARFPIVPAHAWRCLADGQVANKSDHEERQDRDNDASSGHPFLLTGPTMANLRIGRVALKKLRAAMHERKGMPGGLHSLASGTPHVSATPPGLFSPPDCALMDTRQSGVGVGPRRN